MFDLRLTIAEVRWRLEPGNPVGTSGLATALSGECRVFRWREKRAVWLSLEPGRLAHERLVDTPQAGVLSHATAAALHHAGDILDRQVEVILPSRYRARRPEVRAHRGRLRRDEVTLVEDLPVTTPARTVVDLLADGHDRDHLATVAADMLKRGIVTVTELDGTLDEIHLGRPTTEAAVELRALAGPTEVVASGFNRLRG